MGIVSIFTDIWWIKWVYLFSLVPSGLLAHYYFTLGVKFFSKLRFLRFRRKNKNEFDRMQNLRNQIISEVLNT